MKSILSNSKKIEKSDLAQSQKHANTNYSAVSQSRKVQINEPADDGKQKEDQYVGKLHAHITFLNKTVKDMKKKQDEYKNGLVDMLSRDAKPLPDLASDSQTKYKEMKQALTQQINALENQKAKTINKNLGLMKKKEKFKSLLDELEKKHNEIEQTNKKRLADIRDKYKKEKDRREEMDEDVEKWRQQFEKNVTEYDQRMKEIQEKKFNEDLINSRYQQEKALEEEDEVEKRKEYQEVDNKIKELKNTQENDFKYKELKQKNEELSELFKEQGENSEKLRYQSFELDQLIKLGEAEKDKEVRIKRKEAEERKKLRDEYDKQLTILEEYKRKNREKVEKQFDIAVCPALTEVQKKLNKIKRAAKEAQDKFVQNDINYKRLKVEQMKKVYQIERAKVRVSEKKAQNNALTQEVNTKEVEYLEIVSRVTELEQKLAKMRLNDEKLSKTNQKLIIEQEYLEVQADNYEKTVKLQDLVQDLEFSELEKTQQSNLQFTEGLKNLKGLKDQVRMQNLSYHQE